MTKTIIKHLIILSTLLLSACIKPTDWRKAGANEPETVKAYNDCEYEALKATAGNPDPTSRAIAKGDVHTTCMKLKGFTLQKFKFSDSKTGE